MQCTPRLKSLPFIPGHEFSGRVAASGPGGLDHHGVGVGDLVVAEQIIPCRECRFCLEDLHSMCMVSDVFGVRKNAPGAMANYMIFPEKANVFKVSIRLKTSIRLCPIFKILMAVHR